ncbi:hypothetical protein HP456_23360, partial [Bacillus haikouensis]|uniref:hypothetical protein n=1 Tax=Bacillus haikouensis TaxID=1510468 RepID=UPI001C12F172
KQAKDEGRQTDLFLVDFEVFTDYLDNNSPVSPEVEDRIVQEVEPEDPEEPGDGEDDWQDGFYEIIKKIKNWLCKLFGWCVKP